MNDNDVIKALECCKSVVGNCINCPYEVNDCFSEDGTNLLIRDALDLINRRNEEINALTVELQAMRGAANSYKMHYENAQAEIEKLQIRNKTLAAITKNYDWKFANAKSEAIKEFAERLKAVAEYDDVCEEYSLHPSDIGNLVKEMVGERE